jgi:hypothetical protein
MRSTLSRPSLAALGVGRLLLPLYCTALLILSSFTHYYSVSVCMSP